MAETLHEFRRRLPRELALPLPVEDEQGWGFVNADPDRIIEFFDYADCNIETVDYEYRNLTMYEMVDLVIELALSYLAKSDPPRDSALLPQTCYWGRVRDHHAGEMALREMCESVNDPEERAQAVDCYAFLKAKRTIG